MKKGFTLIELLAVIVILAIIAIIAVPIVLNIIKDTKQSATLRSADFYLDGVKNSIAVATLKNINIPDGTYNLKDGDICLNIDCTNKLDVEVDGERPTSGYIKIEKGNITSVQIIISNKNISTNPETGKLEYTEEVEEELPEIILAPGLYDKNNKLLASWDQLNVKTLEMTEGYIASDIAYIVNDAAMSAAYVREPITEGHLMTALANTSPSLKKEVLDTYERIRQTMEDDNRQNNIRVVVKGL
jgi:type IV pilus assembly protein PilA